MNQIQSLLDKFRNISAKDESCEYVRTCQPQAVSFSGSLQDRMYIPTSTPISVNILTDLRIAPPPLTDRALSY